MADLVGSLGAFWEFVNGGNDVFGSFVAVTGDAHQAKVAQDIFRQEVRYERTQQIREDIRDVHKMMMESVQTHVILGSIVLGSCFSMAIEGYPDFPAERTSKAIWMLFSNWAVTFTLLALWLALRFQMRTSVGARERLLRRHRYFVPDDLVVGRMGGRNVVDKVAQVHGWLLSAMNKAGRSQTQAAESKDANQPIWPRRSEAPCRIKVEPIPPSTDETNGSVYKRLDTEPLRKGMHCWLHSSGKGCDAHTILDVPFFLVGETLVRRPWNLLADECKPLKLRVHGSATLYVAAQCIPEDALGRITTGEESHNATPGVGEGIRKALFLDGQVPTWPADELPVVHVGFHEMWRGDSGRGEFQPVEGFSVHVNSTDIELPLYKVVLASPEHGFVDIVVEWKFKFGCEGLLVVMRQGHVHCKEEDWPLAEFHDEITQLMPLRDYSGLYLRMGLSCLIFAAIFMFLARYIEASEISRPVWWFEVLLATLAFLPAFGALGLIPISSHHQDEVMSIASGPDKQTLPVRKLDRLPSLEPPPVPSLVVPDAAHVEAKAKVWDTIDKAQTPSFTPAVREHQPRSCEDALAIQAQIARELQLQESRRSHSPAFVVQVEEPCHGGIGVRSRRHCSWILKSSLLFWTSLLQVLFLGSFIVVVCFCLTSFRHTYENVQRSPHTDIPPGSGAFSSDSATAASPSTDAAASIMLWKIWKIEWPPFFRPTAAVLDDTGELLHFAAGRVLRSFQRFIRESTDVWKPANLTLVVPTPICGFGLVQPVGDLVVVTNVGTHHKVGVGGAMVGETIAGCNRNVLGLLALAHDNFTSFGTAGDETDGPSFSSAALLDASVGADLEALAVVHGGHSVRFCKSFASSPGNGYFKELSRLSIVRTWVGTNFVGSAIHVCAKGVCAANEHVLWTLSTKKPIGVMASDDGVIVSGVGLESGRNFAASEIRGLPVLSGGQHIDGIWHAAALTGNSTHLVAVVVASPGLSSEFQAVVLSAQYVELLRFGGSSIGHEL